MSMRSTLPLTVADVEASCAFYEHALGMRVVESGTGCKALAFGRQKLNLHPHGHGFEPKAQRPTPGPADPCFLTSVPLADVEAHLRVCGIDLIDGPVQRTSATGSILSLYSRDPDCNLVEVSNPNDA